MYEDLCCGYLSQFPILFLEDLKGEYINLSLFFLLNNWISKKKRNNSCAFLSQMNSLFTLGCYLFLVIVITILILADRVHLPRCCFISVLHFYLCSQSLEGKRPSEFASLSPMGTRSRDAAVGILVDMLQTASPLGQDSSCYGSHSVKTEQERGIATASGFFMPRKTTDALEELRRYRELKDLLLSRSGTRDFTREEA